MKTNNLYKKLLFTFIFSLSFVLSWGQVTIWEELFTSYANGTGIDGSGNIGDYPASVSKWTLDISGGTLSATSDYLKTTNSFGGQVMTARDVDGPVIWLSEVISIVGYTNVQLGANFRESGTMESSDYYRIEYKLDGGAWTTFASNGYQTGNYGGWDYAEQTGLSGNNVQIRITLNCNAGSEYQNFDTVKVKGTLSGPTITIDPSTLTSFTYVEGNGPSAEQNFTVEGSNLTNDITVNPPTNWEISLTTGGAFSATNPITLTQSSGTVASTTIYTRMVSGLTFAGSPYSGNISCTSTGATQQDVAVDGTVTDPNAPQVIYSGSFENGNETWSYISNGGTADWVREDDGGIYSPGDTGHDGTYYAWFYGYNKNADDWLISPSYDFSSYTNVTMSFWSWMRNSGPDIVMKISTDYTGGDPTAATWTDLSPTLATTAQQWTASGDVDLSSIADGQSNVHIAFYYTGTDVDRNWAIDDYELKGSQSGPSITLTGTDPTSDDFVQNSNDDIFYKIEVAVAGGTNQQVSKIKFDAVSTGANLDAVVSGYTLRYSTDATLDAGDSNLGTINSAAVTTQSNITFDFSATPVTINSGNTGYFFITTDVLSNATVGATIQATNAGATYTTNGAATDTENYSAGNTHTIVLLKNSESDIVTNNNEANTVSSIMNDATITSTADGTEVWQFTIRDGGSDNTDADNLATIVNAITITQASGNAMNNWDDAILACALFNGNTLISNSPTITSNQIKFSGSPLISVPDEGSVTLSLRISIQTSPNDSGNNNDGDDFGFQISQGNVTADAAGSGFASFPQTYSVNGKNIFDVTATELHFVQLPTDVGVDNVMVPHPSVEATDANENRDLDYTANISLSSNGTMTNDPISVAAAAGIAEFSNVIHTAFGGPFNLSATSGALTATGNSNQFNVTNVTTFDYGDLAILAVNTLSGSNGRDELSFVSFIDILPGTKFYLTDNGYERKFADQWGGTEGVISISRNSSTLDAGTIITITTTGNVTNGTQFDVYTNGAIDNNWTKTALSGTNIGGFNLNNDDDVWIMQGGTWNNSTAHHSTYDGTVLYGWTESGWDAAPGGASQSSKWSTLYPASKCFTTVAPTGNGKVKFYDPNDPDFSTTTNSKLDWIALINETGNWDTYTDNAAYNSGGFDYKGDTNAPQLTIAANNHTEGVWNGSSSTDWFDCSNWETLSVPDETIDVVIDNGAGNEAIVDASSPNSDLYGDIAKTKNMTVEDGIWVEVNTSADKLEVHGNLLIENNATLDMNDDDAGTTQDGVLDLYGNFTNNYDTDGFDEGQSTVNLLGSTTQTITSGHTEEFYNLVVNNTSPTGVVLGGSIDVNGELTHTNGTIDLNGKNLNCSGIYARTNGEFKGNSASNLTFDGTGAVADLHFSAPLELHDLILGRTETVNLQSNLDIYHELQIISGAEIANNGNNINVREVVDINGTHSGTGRIILSNTASGIYAVQGTGSIGNIEMNSAGDDALLGNAVNVNNFTITAGKSFDTDNYNMNVTGNWTNNVSSATFIEGTGTVTYNGTSTQTITAPNGQEFYNLVIDNPTITNASLLTVQNNLTINASDVFTINPGKNVTVTGTLTNTAGATGLIIKSDATGTGSLIHNTANIPATVERFLTGDYWHYIFAPLTEIDTSTYSIVSWGARNPNFYWYNEQIADYWNVTTVYNPTGWSNINSGNNSGKLNTDRGYIHYFLSDKVFSQTGGNLDENDKTFSLTLTDNNGANHLNYIAPPAWPGWDKFDGWNLIGNPFVSAIDWDAIPSGNKTNIENYVYYYDDAQDKYLCYGGNPPFDNNGVSINGGTQYIPAGQSVMVKASSSANFIIPANTRVHSSQAFYKKNTKDVSPNFLKFRIEKDNYFDETIIRAFEGATNEHDAKYDAHKMFVANNDKPQIFTSINAGNSLYAVNSIPIITNNKVIPVSLRIGIAGNYTIRFTENSFENMHIWLEDVALNETLNLLNNSSYTFSQSAEVNKGRFFVHFGLNTNPIVNSNIPDQETNVVELYTYDISDNVFTDNDFEDVLTLSAKLEDGSDLPAWLTFNSELNQFSGTPSDLELLNIKVTATDVFGAEISDYFKLSIKSVSSISKLSENLISVYPNPANNIVTVEFGKTLNSIVSIIDITGKELVSKNVNSKKTEFYIKNFAKGIYFIDIKTNKQSLRKKLIIE